MSDSPSPHVLIVVGDATETVDTLYPFYRLQEAGFRPVVIAPEKRTYQMVLHEVRPGWTITREWEGYQITADHAFAEIDPDEPSEDQIEAKFIFDEAEIDRRIDAFQQVIFWNDVFVNVIAEKVFLLVCVFAMHVSPSSCYCYTNIIFYQSNVNFVDVILRQLTF